MSSEEFVLRNLVLRREMTYIKASEELGLSKTRILQIERKMARFLSRARKTAGFRERYALQNGELDVKGNLWIFRYSPDDPYQDANGATFDTNRMEWVG